MEQILNIANEVGITGLIDIVIMSVVIYSTIVWFKRTKAIFVVMGMFILGIGYLLAREFDLTLTVTVFQAFFAVFLIAVVVIFQEEIKQFFESLARWTTSRGRRSGRLIEIPVTEIEALVSTLADLAAEKIGALVVLQGNDPIVRHLDGGITLNGEVSEPLLKSLFDPHSAGHDGAVVIIGKQITEFGAHLPLSKNTKILGPGGTRHAAALGLSELSDALCLVVSEERGTISATRHGELHRIADRSTLNAFLLEFHKEIVPVQARKPWREFFRRNYREKAIALAATLILWFVFVHEARIGYRTYQIPVAIGPANRNPMVTRIDPPSVRLTFSGPRRSFFFVDETDFSVHLHLITASAGTHPVVVSESNVSFPTALTLEGSDPKVVSVTLKENP